MESLIVTNDQKSVNFFGLMDNIILESGLIIRNMEKVFGDHLRVIYIWVSGAMEKYKVMELIYVNQVKNMKAILKIF